MPAQVERMSGKYRTNPFFNGVSTFKAAFPGLSDALIEWRERRGVDDTRSGDTRKIGFRRGNFTQGLLPCSNPDCREGGYQVDRLIAEMLQLGETERSGVLLCAGREVGDDVRHGPVRCPHRIEYTVTLSDKVEEEPLERRASRRGRNRHRRRNAA